MTEDAAESGPTSHVHAELGRLAQFIGDALANDEEALDTLIEAREVLNEHIRATGASSWADAPPLEAHDEARFESLYLTLFDRLSAVETLRSRVPDVTLVQILSVLIVRDGRVAGDEPYRFLQLSTVAGRVLWAILNDRDAVALRSAIEPGQIWIRADLVSSDEWPLVRAMAANSVRLAGLGRSAGRRQGSGTAALAPIVAAVAADPEMTNAEIAELAREVWTRLRLVDDYDSERHRIARIRKAARRTKNP